MRTLAVILVAAALAACASSGGGANNGEPLGRLPFPVERGSALPPPAPSAGQTAPPEGVASTGVDFAQWRSADPALYAPAFQNRIRQRYAGQSAAQIKADLEANGFACEDGQRLDCRIEIMERQCAYDWYVVVEPGRPEPVAGFDQMCLGAL
jgi:hypothetical protein